MSRCALIFVLLSGCSAGASPAPDAGAITFAIEPTDDLALLFMIDNSASETGQREFPLALPALLAELAATPGGVPSLHAGVITSDLGAGMLPLPNGGCPRVGGDGGVLVRGSLATGAGVYSNDPRFLSTPRGAPGDLASALAVRMNVGLRGCGYEHQLASVAKALDPVATPENAGFLRDDAHLAIIMLTDEDDCSAPPDTTLFAAVPEDQCSGAVCARAGYVCNGLAPPAADFDVPFSACQPRDDGPLLPVRGLVEKIRASKRDPDRQITVEGVFGVPADHPSVPFQLVRNLDCLDDRSTCDSREGGAVLGLRLAAFVAAFGAGGHSHDLCIDDYDRLLADIGRHIARRLTSACTPTPVSSCEVTAGAPLPACRAGGPPLCWQLDQEPGCSSKQLLVIGGAGALSAGTQISARCFAP